MTLKERLTRIGLNKSGLASLCGVTASTVTVWGDDIPEYAETIVSLWEKNIYLQGRVDELKEIVSKKV